MPDITMCSGGLCPMKKTCVRFASIPSEYRQSYFCEIPIKEDGSCEYYWKTDAVSIGGKSKALNTTESTPKIRKSSQD